MAPAALISTAVETAPSKVSQAPQSLKTVKAPQVVGSSTRKATRPTRQLPQSLIDGAKIAKKRSFSPEEHLDYERPSKIHKMAELGLEGAGISPNAISEPFKLFNEEAIKQMRAEIFSEPVLRDCQYKSSFCSNMIRGMGHGRAPFIYDVWKSPEVLAKISEVAGIDLIPAFDFEIANINIAVKDDPKPGETVNTNGTVAKAADADDVPAFAWHFDSFPFVCVTMLSDCTDMVGGETAINLPDGTVKKVRGPAMGYAVVMQGRYLEHQALKALGGRERITMVTAFRPKDPLVTDESILVGVRGISDLGELYPQYFQYRLEVLEERVRAEMKAQRAREVARKPFDVEKARAWAERQREFLDSILKEMFTVE
ncbi:hypothetical protein BDV18DRAFT_161023 [Aspergillus unguis]